jgi:hypothetical protein
MPTMQPGKPTRSSLLPPLRAGAARRTGGGKAIPRGSITATAAGTGICIGDHLPRLRCDSQARGAFLSSVWQRRGARERSLYADPARNSPRRRSRSAPTSRSGGTTAPAITGPLGFAVADYPTYGGFAIVARRPIGPSPTAAASAAGLHCAPNSRAGGTHSAGTDHLEASTLVDVGTPRPGHPVHRLHRGCADPDDPLPAYFLPDRWVGRA